MAGLVNASDKTKKPALSREAAQAIVNEARERIEQSYEADRYNRTEAEADLRFLAGDQWPEETKTARKGRPMLTINRLPQFLRQVTNDIRQADLSIKAAPVDSKSDPDLAKTYDGIIKQIMYASSAHWVFSCAAEHQSACGIGWFRIKSCYASDEVFDQELRIERILDPLSVYDDPGAIKPDRSDAMWRAIVDLVPTETFKQRYPKASVEGMDAPGQTTGSTYLWQTTDSIRIAEYWRKVPVKKTIALMQDGSTLDISEIDKSVLMVLPIQRTREVETHKIEQYIVSGAEVLEGPHEWAGTMLPIVPVIGAEIPVNGRVVRSGVIRSARDPQQLYNFSRSAAAEAIALAPKAPFVGTAKQIGPYKGLWDTHNTTNRPYLLYEHDPNAPGPPKREHPPETPQALYQECQLAAEDMKATTGIYDASLGSKSNENSGIAIQRRQQEGDTATYHFSDNLQFSLEYAGRVLIELIPKIYDNERVLRIIGEDDGEEPIVINQVVMGQDGAPVVLNDLSTGRFDVQVTIGPSQSTRRVEAANAILEFMRVLPPEQAANLSDLVAKNSDWAGADEIAKRLRNMINPAVLVDPDDPDAQPPPDPTQSPEFQMQAAESQAKTEKTLADARKSEAQAEEVEIRNAMTQVSAQMGTHPMLQDPMEEKYFDAEQGERLAQRSDQHRYEDREWSVEDQDRQAEMARQEAAQQQPA